MSRKKKEWVMYPDTEIPLDSFDSENEFERMHQGETWVVGTKRGEIYLEILESCGYDLTHARVLDIGSGHGGVSLVLSQNSAETIGLDTTKKLLRIARKRARISQQENFNALLASGNLIPLKDNCIDIALMIGVFEFIPRCNPFADPEHTHLEVIKGIKRILKKRGALLLGIENRYWLGYWFGKRNHHTGMRFITVLPRKIADFTYKLSKSAPYYLERTYSYFELNNILTKTGFKINKRFTGLPSWGCTETVADIDDRSNVKQRISSIEPWKPLIHGLLHISFVPKVFWKIMISLGLMKFFCSNFLYVCEVKKR